MRVDGSKSLTACLVALFVTFALGSSPAQAGENDVILTKLASFEQNDGAENCPKACGRASKETKLFESFVEDFGQVMAPGFVSPASTPGQAGLSVNLVPSLLFVDADADHWKALEGGKPNSPIFVPRIFVRKGLPFSFEIGGSMSHIIASEMFGLGSYLKWALHEGFEYFPDVAVRGTVNTLVGGKELQMVTAGWDASISYGFPLGGVVEITPYAGYQQLYIWGWSRLLNVYPGDPRAPQQNGSPSGPNTSFNPEFVFSTHRTTVNRFFFGTRLNIWTVDLIFEGVVGGGDVYKGTASLGMSF